MSDEKKLEKGSAYNKFDTNNDGIVSDEEMAHVEKMIQIENNDKKEDAQRGMAWFALCGMLLYPFAVVYATYLNLNNAATVLGSMAATYFVSVAGIVMAFFGTQAWQKTQENKNV